MFSDPINRQSQPFMAEGRATAQGERTLQIFKAAVSKSSDKWALEDMRRFFSGIGDPSYKGPEVGSVVKIDQAIDDQPFTVFQTAAACHVSDSATDAKYLIRQLEMPAAFFNDQASDEMRAAYYVAWSLFHYGDERERRGQGGSRLDVGIIRKAADLVARNRKIEGQDLTTLDAYLAEVQRRARADIKSKGISCPKNGNL
ncbi:hypothetical protein [Bradyrhizobium tunisiense]